MNGAIYLNSRIRKTPSSSVTARLWSAFGGILLAGLLVQPAFAQIYVANSNSSNPSTVLVFNRTDSGNVAPSRTISDLINLSTPFAVAVDSSRVYAGSLGNNTIDIYSRTASGASTPLATISGSSTGITAPAALAVDSNYIYLADNPGPPSPSSPGDSIRIFSLTASGNVSPVATIKGSNTGLNFPQGVAVDSNNIYVSNSGNNTITVYPLTTGGSVTTGNVAPARTITGLNAPNGLVVNATNIFVVNAGAASIAVYALGDSGAATPARTIIGGSTGLSANAYGLAIDSGSIYVAQGVDNRINIYALGASGNAAPTATIAGSSTTFNSPLGIAVSTSLPPPTVTISGTTSFTYNGSPQGPTSANVNAGGSTGTITMSYSGTGGTTYGPSATRPTNAGSYTATASVAADTNFSAGSSSATAFTIGTVTLTYTANSASRAYGAANPTFSGTVTGFVGSDTQANATTGTLAFATTATSSSNAGSYAISGSGLTANNGNYTFAQASGNATALTITAATLTYTANSASRAYGATNPTFSGTVTGFVGSDTQANATTGTLAFATTATSSSNAGSYAISGSGLTANNGNYTFAQASGNATALTINQATATVSVPTQTVAYTGSPIADTATTTPSSLSLTYSYTGTNGTTYAASANPPTNIGTYTVAATVNDTNYSGSGSGTLTIAAVPTVTSVNPTTGVASTATFVILRGTNFGTGLSSITSVTYGANGTGSTLSGISWLSSTQLSGTVGTDVGAGQSVKFIVTVNGISSAASTATYTGIQVQISPTITWSPAPTTVGAPLSDAQLNATATYNGQVVGGTFSYTPSKGEKIATVGNSTLSAAFTPNDTTTYSSVTTTAQLTVNAAATTTTASSASVTLKPAQLTTSTFASGFTYPIGLAFDAQGSLYVANYSIGTVSKVTSAGVASTFASGLSNPDSLAFDAQGSLYVANFGAGTVSKVTSTGVVSIFASGFSSPVGMAFDAQGNLYVANSGNGTVSKVTSTGVVSIFASGFSNPAGLAFDAQGNLYVANYNTGTVSKVTSAGGASTFASGFSKPDPLAFDAQGSLYVANYNTGTVSKVALVSPAQTVSLSATVTSAAGTVSSGNVTFTVLSNGAALGSPVVGNVTNGTATATYTLPAGTATGSYTIQATYSQGGSFGPSGDSSQVLAVSNATISTTTTAASASVTSSSSGAVAATFVSSGLNSPSALACDSSGILYVASGDNSIRKVASDGTVTPFVPAASGLKDPAGLFFDASGNLYVGNRGSAIINKVASDGTVTVFNSSFSKPTNLAIDPSGGIYVVQADSSLWRYKNGTFTQFDTNVTALAMDSLGNLYESKSNNNIWKYSNGTWTLVASTAPGIKSPTALACDSSGNLYIANGGNNTISVVTSGGAVSTYVSSGINSPTALACDASGNLYVANGDNTISRVAKGTLVSLTATVTSASGTVNGGTVTFTVLSNGAALGSPVSSNVANGTATATYTLPAGTAPGSYSIQARYNPASGGTFVASSDNSQVLTAVNLSSPTVASVRLSDDLTKLIITGTNFQLGSVPVLTGSLGQSFGTSATAVVVSATEIDVVLGSGATVISNQSAGFSVTLPKGTATFVGAIGSPTNPPPVTVTLSALPSISPGSPANITATISGLGGRPAASANWASASLQVTNTSASHATVTPASVGSYTVSLTVTNFLGTSGTGSVTINAVQPPSPTVSIRGPSQVTITSANSLSIVGTATAAAPGSSLSLNWSVTPTLTLGSSAGGSSLFIPTHTLKVGSTYTFTFTATDTVSLSSASAKVTVTVVPSPLVVSIAGGASVSIPNTASRVVSVTTLDPDTGAPPANASISFSVVDSSGHPIVDPATGSTFVAPTTNPMTLPAGLIGTVTVTATASAGSRSGTYTQTITFIAGKINPVITWPTPARIAYGAPLPSAILNATANVDGKFSYDTSAYDPTKYDPTQSPPASATLNATFVPKDTTNYATVTASVALPFKQVPAVDWTNSTATFNGAPVAGKFSDIKLASDGTLLVPAYAYAVGGNYTTQTLNSDGSSTISAPKDYVLRVGTPGQFVPNDTATYLPVFNSINAVYSPPPVSSNGVRISTQFSSQPVISANSYGPGTAVRKALASNSSATDPMAAALSLDGRSGFLTGYISSLGQGYACNFTPDSSGNFTATTTTFGGTGTPVTLTITGTATAFEIKGTIQPLGIAFDGLFDSLDGPAAALAGIYQSSGVNSASGTTYTLVDSQGNAFVMEIASGSVAAGTGTVNPANGSLTVQLSPSGTATGTIKAGSQSVSETVTTSGGTVGFSGLSSVAPPATTLVNLSALGSVTPASSLTVGFVVNGPQAKTVLLRGVGPGLAGFGVRAPLAVPRLSLYSSSGSLLGNNSGWGGAALSSAFATAGAFALSPSSADSALLMTLQPGAYTAVVSDGANDAGGPALAEIYDMSIDPTEDGQSLVNESTLGTVTAASPLTGGFSIKGNSPKKVLIRAVGPGLASFGVANPLADPMVVVTDTSGNVLARNNDWATATPVSSGQPVASASEISAATASAGAFPLPASSKDSSLIVTLAPGNYTAIVTGVGGAAGTALVEIYEVR